MTATLRSEFVSLWMNYITGTHSVMFYIHPQLRPLGLRPRRVPLRYCVCVTPIIHNTVVMLEGALHFTCVYYIQFMHTSYRMKRFIGMHLDIHVHLHVHLHVHVHVHAHTWVPHVPA